MQYVYDKYSKRVTSKFSDNIDVGAYFRHYPKEFVESKDVLKLDSNIEDYKNYKVIDNELIRMTDLEIQEIRMYGKILTEEERLLESMKPSQEEVKKAENQIEILSLLQEVLQ